MKSIPMFAALLLLPAALLGGANRWTSSGPDVGVVSRILTVPQDASESFALTAEGIYKTTDGGQSWRPANNGLPGSSIRAFVAATDRTLYVSIADRIFGTDDAGEHWSGRGSMGSVIVWALAADPTSNTLIAGTNPASGITPGMGRIYFSDDGAQTWTQSNVRGVVGFSGIDFIVISATAAYARTTAPQIYLRSTDGGRTWQPMNPPPSELYADPSTSWLYSRSIDAQSVMVSKDEGLTWIRLPSRSDFIDRVIPVAKSAYIITSAGVFVFTDGASSWQTVINARIVDAFAVSSSAPRRLYAGPGRGVVTSVEGDDRWLPSNAGLPGASITDIDMANTDPSTAYATTDAGVFRTDDGGTSWIPVNPSTGAKHVAISPATADTAYISVDTGGIQRTTDRGETWKTLTPDFARVLAIAPSDARTLYASFSSSMQKSLDTGDTWSKIDDGLFLGYYGFFPTSIAIDPSSASRVVMATQDAIATTSNGGGSWTQVNWNVSAVSGLTLDPYDPSIVFGGQSIRAGIKGGVIRSNDGGASWNPAGLSDKSIATLLIRGASLYAGTYDGHIYRSDDRGKSWIGFDEGITLGSVIRLVADSAGKHVLAATPGGVYRYEVLDQNITPLPVADDSLGLPQILDAIAVSPHQNAALIIPIAGTVGGLGGTMFTTELLLSNANPTPEKVRVSWLPRGGDGEIASFELTIPGASDASGGTVHFFDIAKSFSKGGVGSLIVEALDPSGNLDATASIDASTIVWSDFGDGRAPVSQSIPVARANLLAAHNAAVLGGLQHDAQFRTNAGIVNLSAQHHQFTIQINGERSSGQFTIDVPPLSVVHTSLPDGDYGALFLNVVADSADARWLLYGSLIDPMTGEAQTSLASLYK